MGAVWRLLSTVRHILFFLRATSKDVAVEVGIFQLASLGANIVAHDRFNASQVDSSDHFGSKQNEGHVLSVRPASGFTRLAASSANTFLSPQSHSNNYWCS
eukprot:scaffold6325_cov95-Cylindrotheca_fusiformis.AAC.1